MNGMNTKMIFSMDIHRYIRAPPLHIHAVTYRYTISREKRKITIGTLKILTNEKRRG